MAVFHQSTHDNNCADSDMLEGVGDEVCGDVECLRKGAVGGAPSLFSRQVPELSPSHIYCQVSSFFKLDLSPNPDALQITQPAFLKPLYFEVPKTSPSPLVGRSWLFREVKPMP